SAVTAVDAEGDGMGATSMATPAPTSRPNSWQRAGQPTEDAGDQSGYQSLGPVVSGLSSEPSALTRHMRCVAGHCIGRQESGVSRVLKASEPAAGDHVTPDGGYMPLTVTTARSSVPSGRIVRIVWCWLPSERISVSRPSGAQPAA